MTIHRHAMQSCPWCGYKMDAATGGDEPPDPGDAGLCDGCGEWMIFERDSFRKPTDKEHEEIAEDARCRHMRAIWLTGRQPRTI